MACAVARGLRGSVALQPFIGRFNFGGWRQRAGCPMVVLTHVSEGCQVGYREGWTAPLQWTRWRDIVQPVINELLAFIHASFAACLLSLQPPRRRRVWRVHANGTKFAVTGVRQTRARPAHVLGAFCNQIRLIRIQNDRHQSIVLSFVESIDATTDDLMTSLFSLLQYEQSTFERNQGVRQCKF